tara:strand:+ start:2463 stop:3266 length:804 start_codon:yes stop_codon:yes gene_type:complete
LNNILISIIVPVKEIYKWENNIIQNIELFKQLNFEYEFLFVYSNPIDNSIIQLKHALSNEKKIIFIQDDGNGIYSAMNKGIESSKGEFLIFVGADDSFNHSKISNFLDILKTNDSDLILFEVLFKGESKKRKIFKTEGGITTLIHWTLGQPRVHQAIVYKRAFIVSKKIKYLTKLKVTSDYIFTSEFCSHKPSILKKNIPIIFYNKDGFSSKFSYSYRYLEHIQGYFLIPRLRKYLCFVIVSRVILILYKHVTTLLKKFKLIFLKTF